VDERPFEAVLGPVDPDFIASFCASDRARCSRRLAAGFFSRLICPPLSGPETMIVWTTKGTMNAEQEAQTRRDYRQAA